MKKLLLSLTLTSFLLGLVGCASSVQVINPSWVDKPATLTILISEPYVINKDDLADDLPNELNTFPYWFSGKLSTAIANRTSLKVIVRVMTESDFILEKVQLSNGKNIIVPKPKQAVDGELVLCISPIKTSHHEETSMSHNDPGMMNSTMSSSLRYEANYAYYDAKKGTNLGYGLVDVRSSFNFFMDASNWEENVVKMVELLVKGTPLIK